MFIVQPDHTLEVVSGYSVACQQCVNFKKSVSWLSMFSFIGLLTSIQVNLYIVPTSAKLNINHSRSVCQLKVNNVMSAYNQEHDVYL